MIDAHTFTQVSSPLKGEFSDDDDSEPFKAKVKGDQYDQGHQAGSTYDRWPLSIGNTQGNIPSEMLLILPNTTVGFDMQEKTWGQSASFECDPISSEYRSC
jgi:hypothetical protein